MVLEFIQSNLIQFISTFIAIAIYIILYHLNKSFIRTFGTNHNLKEKRIIYVQKLNSIFLLLILIVSLSIVWSLKFESLLIFGSSFLAISGVALFAAWSNLSNLTSSVIIFFTLPFKIDDSVKILDGDNTVEGKIIDMTLFHVLLEGKDQKLISYPNNIFIQKVIVGNK